LLYEKKMKQNYINHTWEGIGSSHRTHRQGLPMGRRCRIPICQGMTGCGSCGWDQDTLCMAFQFWYTRLRKHSDVGTDSGQHGLFELLIRMIVMNVRESWARERKVRGIEECCRHMRNRTSSSGRRVATGTLASIS
jgi:hypothetical protein